MADADALYDNDKSPKEEPKFEKKPNYKVGDTEYENVDPNSRKGMGGDEDFAGEISRPGGKEDTTPRGKRFYHYRKNKDGTRDMYAPVREEKPSS